MKKLVLSAFVLALAAPALAGDPQYDAGFGYQVAPPAGSQPRTYRRYDDRHHHGHGRRPSREVTTITPLENGGTRIETRRDYEKRGVAKFRPDKQL